MHTATLLLELGAVIFGLGLLGRLAGLIGLSPIPLYLLGGLAFGSGGLFPLSTPTGFIETGAEVGVVLLLLLLGLEYSAAELVGNLRVQAPMGILDLLMNSVPGVVLALVLGYGPLGALVLAGVTAVSSSGIVAKLLADLGRLGNHETPTVLSILVLEDLGMAVYLPVLTALLTHASGATLALSLLVALGTLVVVLVVALRFGTQISAVLAARSDEVLLLSILGLALLVAGGAESVHVSAAVGAFLLGIALSGPTAEKALPLLEPLRDLFAAVFFVFFGLQTDPSTLPAVLLPALGLLALGVATKLLTGIVAARRAGVGVGGQVRAGAVLIPRGEFSIVIGGLALSAGLQPRLGALVAAYVLGLAVLGSFAPQLADPIARRLHRRSLARAGMRAA